MDEEVLIGFMASVYEEIKETRRAQEKCLDVLMMLLKNTNESDMTVVDKVHNHMNLRMTDDWQANLEE